MRHITISKTTADLHRLEFVAEPVVSFYVSERGTEHVDYGDDGIPRAVAVFDPHAEETERVTLEGNPLRWADLLPLAYRGGDYQVTVTEEAQVREGRQPVGGETLADKGIPAGLEALSG